MTPAGRTWKLIDLLDTTVEYFRKKEIESPRIDAEYLLADLLGKKRIELYTAFDQPLTDDEVDRFRERVRRRGAGEPVQRIVGETEFYSLRLAIAPGVFIPRPETELLVDEALARLGADGRRAARRGFDAGTGSGAIAVALAHGAPGIAVQAVDSDPAAVSCAAENAAFHALSDRVRAAEGDFARLLAEEEEPFDLVLSNPPYITTAEMLELPREVKGHDPEGALHGGGDGLDFYRRIVPAAAEKLRPGGALIVEVSDTVCAGVVNLIEEDGRYAEAAVRKDYSGHRRVVTAPRG